jgi:microcystin-dependent protein
MATVTGLTAAKMLELADENVIDAAVVNDRLIFTRRDGTTFDAGIVKGDPGSAGPSGVGPTGSITMFAGAAAPTGHLLCDGSPVSRSTYSALFDVIGTTYGVGNNVDTFNLPNLKGRVPVGLDPEDTSFDARGETGGAKSHTLTATEMPVHTHVQNSHAHTGVPHTHTQDAHDHPNDAHSHGSATLTGFVTYGTVGRTRVAAGTTSDRIAITATDTAQLGIFNTVTADATNNSHTLTGSNNESTQTINSATAVNQNAGSGGAHNNLQPYIVLNYIIKT